MGFGSPVEYCLPFQTSFLGIDGKGSGAVNLFPCVIKDTRFSAVFMLRL
jgi:hypothetical protein